MIRRLPRATLFPYTTLFRSIELSRNQASPARLRCEGPVVRTSSAPIETISSKAVPVHFRMADPPPLFRVVVASFRDRKSTRLNSSHVAISYAVFCLKKKIMQCVAVSQTPDPTGAYNRYSFSYGSTDFNDYPKIGVWPDAYYTTCNIFANSSIFRVAR